MINCQKICCCLVIFYPLFCNFPANFGQNGYMQTKIDFGSGGQWLVQCFQDPISSVQILHVRRKIGRTHKDRLKITAQGKSLIYQIVITKLILKFR
uniref:Putative ovule protein n=1 Tax=Solanum chacoense TaxID=4108 RepID=A0A0V0HMI5_SOLCH